MSLDLYGYGKAGEGRQSGGVGGGDEGLGGGIKVTTQIGAAKQAGGSLTGRTQSHSEALVEGTTTKPWWWYGVSPSQMTEMERNALNHHDKPLSERMRFIINQSPSILDGVHQRMKTPVPKYDIETLLRNSPSRNSHMSTVSEGPSGDVGRDEPKSVEFEYGSIDYLLANAPSQKN
jgi:hypothetical protein